MKAAFITLLFTFACHAQPVSTPSLPGFRTNWPAQIITRDGKMAPLPPVSALDDDVQAIVAAHTKSVAKPVTFSWGSSCIQSKAKTEYWIGSFPVTDDVDADTCFWTVYSTADWKAWRMETVTIETNFTVAATEPHRFYIVTWRNSGTPRWNFE